MAFQFLCPQGHLLQADESHAGQQSQCPYCGSMFLIPQPLATAPPDPSTAAGPAPSGAGFEPPPQQQPGGEVPPFPSPDAQAPWFQQPADEPPAFEPPSTQPPPFQAPDVGSAAFQPPDGGPPTFEPPAAETQAEAEVADFPGIRTEPQVGRGHGAADVPSEFKVPDAAELPIVHIICPNGHRLETPREMLDQEALCPFCQVQFRLRLEDSVEYREQKAKEQRRREIRAGQLWLRWAIAAAVVVVLGLVILIVLSASR